MDGQLSIADVCEIMNAVELLYPRIVVTVARGRGWYSLSLQFEGKQAWIQALTRKATIDGVVAFINHCLLAGEAA